MVVRIDINPLLCTELVGRYKHATIYTEVYITKYLPETTLPSHQSGYSIIGIVGYIKQK